MSLILKLIISVILPASAVILVFAWIKARRRRILDRLHLKLFLLRFPKRKRKGEGDLLKEIALMEQLYGSISSFKKSLVFEVAVPHIGEEIYVYVAVPPELSQPFLRQVHSLWDNVMIEEAGDYNIFNSTGIILGGWMKLKDKFHISIKTYQEFNSDTFQSILGGLAKINEIGEGGAVQVLVRSAANSYKKGFKSTLKELKKGKKGKDEEKPIVDEAAVKAVEKKLTKPLFEVNIRVLVSAPSQAQAESVFEGITAGFSQFATPEGNEFKLTKPRNIRQLAHRFSFREFSDKERIILNSEELASVFHFPTSFTEVPRLHLLKSLQLPPPSNLPSEGTIIGESAYRGERKTIHITENDRRRHFYIIGQTGTGKSNLLVNMVVDDIRKGRGVGIIDPHGDLVEHIAGLIPKERYNDVILFDPTSLDNPSGLNMLEYDLDHPEQKTLIVNELLGIFDKLYDMKTAGGPMFEQYMRNALLLLMEGASDEPATLMEVPRVFTDAEYRKRKLSRIKNPAVIDFWEKEAVKAGGDAALANITPYITSKFNNFTTNEYMRVIVGQPYSAFNFRKVMDEGKILLVNLSKGKIGELNANLLGMIIVGKILIAALGRADVPEEKRRDFNLFIDEFQNFTTDSIATILSEARKYHLSLTIAHQFIAQLKDSVRDAVFGNVGSTIAFRVGAPDAETLIKQFEPALTTEDLINIGNYNAYVRLLLRGETVAPFNIKTFRAPLPNPEAAKKLQEITREKYGKPRELVEEEIYRRLRE